MAARKPDALALADPAHPDFRLGASPLYWLARVAGRYRLDMDRVLKPIGMDVPRWRVLAILSEYEPASVTELCDPAVIRLSTMTRIVQRLADSGLVTTRPRDGGFADRGRAPCCNWRSCPGQPDIRDGLYRFFGRGGSAA